MAEREIREDREFFDNLYRVLDVLLEFRSEHELFIKLSQEVRDIGTPKAHEGLTKVENGIVGYLKGIVERAMASGEIKPLDAQVVSFVMLKLYIALTTDLNQLHAP